MPSVTLCLLTIVGTTVAGCTSTTAVRQCRQIRAKAIENS